MGLFGRSKKASDNKNMRELMKIKRTLASSGRKPEVKISSNINVAFDAFVTSHNMNVLLFYGEKPEMLEKHIERNISAADRNYVITDKSGKLYEKYAKWLEEKGYTVSCLDKGMLPEQFSSEMLEFVFGRKALFITVPDDNTGNPLAGFYINKIIDGVAEEMSKKGIVRPQNPLHFILNTIDTIGAISNFEDILLSADSKTYAFSILASSVNNLSNAYKDKWESIAAKCDSHICLSKPDEATERWISLEEQEVGGQTKLMENERVMETVRNLDDGMILAKIRGFVPVTDRSY